MQEAYRNVSQYGDAGKAGSIQENRGGGTRPQRHAGERAVEEGNKVEVDQRQAPGDGKTRSEDAG